MDTGIFLSLGDSVAQGEGDELPDGSRRGWVRRLAPLLGDVCGRLAVVDLAERNARAPQVRIRQLPAAARTPARIASVVVGMNDALGSFSPEGYRRNYEAIVGELSAIAPIVLTATLADLSPRLGLAPLDAERVGRQIRQANTVVREVSAKYRTVCLDADTVGGSTEERLWLPDGLHPSPAGHRLIATAFAELIRERLGGAGGAATPGARLDARRFTHLALHPRREAIAATLAEDVELWTPATPHAFTGREAVSTVLAIFLGDVVDDLSYGRGFEQADSLCMTFSGRISGHPCEGVDIVELDAAGLVRRCTVFIRPLPAVLAMSRKLAVSLGESGVPVASGT
ncbi:SGNH/GDSL hydrolase family protein [Embleya hyalina]|uniref:SGNH hydrolase n=1 Tax=Embleya hyalina TaxID=516124 RepID=A0A401Z532_9ACTN|nr:SGNH/GDSL hydrolase family protein [Embleya hyalina]GCE01954.1 SGNH hydrolase [Embleya hyalina]